MDMRWLVLTACFGFCGLAAIAGEGDELPAASASPTGAPIDPAAVEEIWIDPANFDLSHARAVQRILVSGRIGDAIVDLTDAATVESSDPTVVRVDELREASAAGDGAAEVIATFGSHTVRASVRVENAGTPRPISFTNEIEPILSKLGCNSGGCHGKSGGQNGFRLSLLAYQPEADFESIVKEARGRRVFPAAADQSLLLRKATGRLPHGGGKRMQRDDANHQLIVAWIRQGMPYGDGDPVVVRIDVHPQERVLGRNAVQRLRVAATYSDGRVEDATRQAQFQSNDESVATVDDDARVRTHEQSGEAAIMVRYQGQVTVFRAIVPMGRATAGGDLEAVGEVDRLVQRKWKDLGLAGSRRTTDGEFVRRIYVDLCGRLPTAREVVAFVNSGAPAKRRALIDELLESADYASHMAMIWGALLQNKRGGRADYAPGTHAMSLWLKDAFHRDMPYDEFVRAVLTATGTPVESPPVVWYRQVRTPEQNVDNVSQLFLGTRIQCAQCHHHPFERWGQDDYTKFASFFARVSRKPYQNTASGEAEEAVFVARSGLARHPATGKEMNPAGLGGPEVAVAAGEDPRAKLVDWMTAPDNPYFARALVNRLWGHFFGRGIVEPVDDMRVTNPPTNPALLDWLAKDFIDHGYSVKHTIRTIVNSSTYQRASEPNASNAPDRQNFARYYPKRLPAEVLLDAIDAVTEAKTEFSYPGEMRAVDLPDESVSSYFLDVFGRPARQSSCECERTSDANLSQALHLLNSQEIQAKISADAGRASKMASDERPLAEKIRELYLSFFARSPTDEELKIAGEYIESKEDKRAAFQNLIWALINTKEFQFNI
jgi:cytochrome c553